MNLIDAALQAHTPAIMVPRHEALAPLEGPGHRFLVSRSGLWVEAQRAWCRVVWPLALVDHGIALPFGDLEPRVELTFGRLPEWPIVQFIEQARKAYPLETAGVVVWSEGTNELRYEACRAISASAGHVKSHWPTLGPGEAVVIDLHSHGALRAFFSGQDRSDIGSDVVVAGVVGRLDQASPEIAISLFACGVEIPVTLPPSQSGHGLSEDGASGIVPSEEEFDARDAPLPAG